MNIFRGRRKEKLYQDWSKYSGLPQEDIPHPEPKTRTIGVRNFPPGLLIYVLFGVALVLIMVGLGLLLFNQFG